MGSRPQWRLGNRHSLLGPARDHVSLKFFVSFGCFVGFFVFTRFSGSSRTRFVSPRPLSQCCAFSSDLVIVPAVCGINLARSLTNRLLIGWVIALPRWGGWVVSLFPMGPALGRGHRLHIWCAAYRDRICGLVPAKSGGLIRLAHTSVPRIDTAPHLFDHETAARHSDSSQSLRCGFGPGAAG